MWSVSVYGSIGAGRNKRSCSLGAVPRGASKYFSTRIKDESNGVRAVVRCVSTAKIGVTQRHRIPRDGEKRMSNTKPSPWSPYRAPGESLLQPPAPTPIRFADLPDDIAFWSAVVLACASTEDVRTIDVALKWADTLLEERRRRFGEVKR